MVEAGGILRHSRGVAREGEEDVVSGRRRISVANCSYESDDSLRAREISHIAKMEARQGH